MLCLNHTVRAINSSWALIFSNKWHIAVETTPQSSCIIPSYIIHTRFYIYWSLCNVKGFLIRFLESKLICDPRIPETHHSRDWDRMILRYRLVQCDLVSTNSKKFYVTFKYSVINVSTHMCNVNGDIYRIFQSHCKLKLEK